jgi:predicted nucleic acid-binding protein
VIIVVDTNIVFSGIISSSGVISDLIINSNNSFDFYAPSFIHEELDKHQKSF